MGVDFNAIFDHRLSWEELVNLPKIIRPIWVDPPGAVSVHPNLASLRHAWRWSLDRDFSSAGEQLFDAGHVSLDGPVGFSAKVFRKAVSLTHLARWWSFVFEPEVRQGLLEASTLMAQALRSTTIIYLPDSGLTSAQGSDLVFDGATPPEILAWLGEHVGSPQPSFDALGHGASELNDCGYYVQSVSLSN